MTLSFNLEFDALGAKYGWMDCWIVINGQYHWLEATNVFPPFQDMLRFIRVIATDTLPNKFFWDEEGHGAEFTAKQSSLGADYVRIRITHDGEIVMDADVVRKQIIQATIDVLHDFALDCPNAETEWGFPYRLVEDFKRVRLSPKSRPQKGKNKAIIAIIKEMGKATHLSDIAEL